MHNTARSVDVLYQIALEQIGWIQLDCGAIVGFDRIKEPDRKAQVMMTSPCSLTVARGSAMQCRNAMSSVITDQQCQDVSTQQAEDLSDGVDDRHHAGLASTTPWTTLYITLLYTRGADTKVVHALDDKVVCASGGHAVAGVIKRGSQGIPGAMQHKRV